MKTRSLRRFDRASHRADRVSTAFISPLDQISRRAVSRPAGTARRPAYAPHRRRCRISASVLKLSIGPSSRHDATHAEARWVLSCRAPFPRRNRPQFFQSSSGVPDLLVGLDSNSSFLDIQQRSASAPLGTIPLRHGYTDRRSRWKRSRASAPAPGQAQVEVVIRQNAAPRTFERA